MTAPVPDSPPRWPAWYGLAALVLSLFIAIIAGGLVFAIVKAAGVDVTDKSPGINVAATLIQDGVLVGCALWLASQTARPRAWHFGLRPTPFWRGVGWALLALAVYLAFQLVYVAAFHPHEKQTTLQDLGAGTGGIATVAIGILVVGVAPVAEEFFFRGFLYGALRTYFSFLPAALIAALVFGLIHAPTGIQAVPPLVALGFAFCMCYEATGSIYPTIALHALNNMLAFGVDKDGSWAVAAAVAGAVVAGCIVVPGMTARPRPRAATG